jgi:hypothetical protein
MLRVSRDVLQPMARHDSASAASPQTTPWQTQVSSIGEEGVSVTRLRLSPRSSGQFLSVVLAFASTVSLLAVALSAAGCGCPSGPARTVLLLDTTETVRSGATMEFHAPRRDDANSVYADLTWSGDATLGLDSEAIGCGCRSVCPPLLGTGPHGPNERHLRGDISCTRDGYRLTVVGDAVRDTEFRLVVNYETAVCER